MEKLLFALKNIFPSLAENFVLLLERMFKGSMHRYIDISSPVDDYTFTTEDGTLITTLRFKGLREIVGAKEFNAMIESLTTKWAPYFSMGSHPIKFLYLESSDDVKGRIDSAQEQARIVAERLELDLGVIFDGRRDVNARYCHHEEVYISLGTTKEVLAKHLQASAVDRRIQRKKTLPNSHYTQEPQNCYPEMFPAHSAFVDAIIGDFSDVKAVVEKVAVDDMVIATRKMVEASFTGDDWRPRLSGDRPTMRIPDRETEDFSTLLYPTIAEQIFPHGGGYKGSNNYEIGDTIFTSLYIHIQPRKIPVFASLFNRIHKNEPLPWSIAFDLDGSGFQQLDVKVGLTAMLRFTDFGGTTNRSIVTAGIGLKRLLESEAGARFRICLTTWAKKGEPELLKHRASMLIHSVQGWGECEVKEEVGDPAQGVVSTLPGVGFSNIGTAAFPPLKDAIRMLPLQRPASPWDDGSILYRTFDGKIWPYQAGSAKQESCIDIFVANPRQGKTTLAYLRILSYVLNPRNAQIPCITTLDVGDPGEGFVELIKEALPDSKQDLAIYKKLKNREEDGFNVLTPLLLGSRKPTSRETQAHVNYLLQLTHTDPKVTPHEDLPGLINKLLSHTFESLSDQGNPAPYRAHTDADIDKAIAEEGIEIDGRTTWWELVDTLFDKNRITEAQIAQNHAAPLLHHLISSLSTSESIRHLYGTAQTDRHEELILNFQRKLIEATAAFPQLTKPTKLNLGNARIKVFNLEDVAPEGDAYRTSVMYLAVGHISSGLWFLDEDDAANVADRYRSYHAAIIKDLESSIKYLYWDEVHRTEGAIPVQKQMANYCVEKTKKGLHLGFSSQVFSHFNKIILKVATNIHILNGNRQGVVDDATTYWKLTETERQVLKNSITGKSIHGSTFFYIFETDEGLHKQALRFSASPNEIWALTTTQMDKNLKKALRERVGRVEASTLLSKAFVGGSATIVIEKRMKDRKTDEQTTINALIHELIETQGKIYV